MYLPCNLAVIGIGVFSSSEVVRNDTSILCSVLWYGQLSLETIHFFKSSHLYTHPLHISVHLLYFFYFLYHILLSLWTSDTIVRVHNGIASWHKTTLTSIPETSSTTLQICVFTFMADKTFSFYLATMTCSSICMMCFSLFQLVIKKTIFSADS